jgi:hypothetical protein
MSDFSKWITMLALKCQKAELVKIETQIGLRIAELDEKIKQAAQAVESEEENDGHSPARI